MAVKLIDEFKEMARTDRQQVPTPRLTERELEVLRLVAEALGVPLRARARWDEQRIARALGTDPAREPACIVVDLGGRRAH